MSSSDYNRYLSAINSANDSRDSDIAKKALREIQTQLIANYGLSDPDVTYLIKQFRYPV